MPCPLLATWAWILSLDPLGVFLLGFPSLWLYYFSHLNCFEVRGVAIIHISFISHSARPHWCCYLSFLKNFPEWCLLLLAQGGKVGHREIRIWLWRFISSDWEELQVEYLLCIHALTSILPLVPPCSMVAFLRRFHPSLRTWGLVIFIRV
jgi:hypothetical protein